jgi:ADP-ribosylglycohydrolase
MGKMLSKTSINKDLLPSLESSISYKEQEDGTITSEIFELSLAKEESSMTKYVRASIFDIETRGTIARDKKKISEILSSHSTKITLEEDRALGSMLGMVIGDAMGHRFEFQDVVYDTITLRDMGTGKGGDFNLEPGQWTDDTSMGLCLADSLLVNNGNFNPRDLMHRFLLWWNCGYNNAFRYEKKLMTSCGLGGNIQKSFWSYVNEKGKNPYTKAGDKNTSGNGSVMRNAAVPICFYKDMDKARDISKKQSKVTHQGDEAASCCELLSFIIVKLINGGELKNILDNLNNEFKCEVESVNILAKSEQEGNDVDRNWNWKDKNFKYSENRVKRNPGYIGSYCMDCMAMALHVCYYTNSFDEAIIKVVNLRGDSDSVGSVVGQIAGAYYGLRKIPKEWIKVVQKWDHQEIALRGYMLLHLFDDLKSRVVNN